MNYSKILMSASMIAFVSALVFGGTQAFFSDEETSEGNLFTAGAIDLLVDSEAHYAGLVCENDVWVDDPNIVDDTTRPDLLGEACNGTWEATDLGPSNQFFNYGDLKPGDSGENTISLRVNDNDAYACAIIDNMQDDDNGINEPEGEAGDVTDGAGGGELSSELRFFAWADVSDVNEIGNNIWEAGEPILFSNTEGPASDVIDGVVYPLFTPDVNGGAVLQAETTEYIGLYWCYGDITVDAVNNTLSCSGASASNLTQTDSLSADFTFYVEQARNNENFVCPILDAVPVDETIVVTAGDLANDLSEVIAEPTSWFFYNDETDVIDNALGTFVSGPSTAPEGLGGAEITVTGTERRNLATYQFSGIQLADITTLAFSTYNPSAGNGGSVDRSAYLNFNIDFDVSDTWQNRLLFVPRDNGSVTQDAWQEWDAIDGGTALWGWSGFVANGNTWPDGDINTLRTWDDLVSSFPGIRVRVTDSWFGMRVGEPYADGYTENLDAFKFGTAGGTQTFDFEPTTI